MADPFPYARVAALAGVSVECLTRLEQGRDRRPSAPVLGALAGELTVTAGDDFARRVGTVPGLARPCGVVRFRHPGAGLLRLAYETLDRSADDQRLIVYPAADPETAEALDKWVSPVGVVG